MLITLLPPPVFDLMMLIQTRNKLNTGVIIPTDSGNDNMSRDVIKNLENTTTELYIYNTKTASNKILNKKAWQNKINIDYVTYLTFCLCFSADEYSNTI